MKQGQTALEFLSTYGWGLFLVLMAVLVMAYFGVVDPAALAPEKCDFLPGTEIRCVDQAAYTDGSLVVKVENLGENAILEDAACIFANDNERIMTKGVRVEDRPAKGEPWPQKEFLELTCAFDGDNPFAGQYGKKREVSIALTVSRSDTLTTAEAPIRVEVER